MDVGVGAVLAASGAGKFYLYRGTATGLSATAARTLTGTDGANSLFGGFVAGINRSRSDVGRSAKTTCLLFSSTFARDASLTSWRGLRPQCEPGGDNEIRWCRHALACGVLFFGPRQPGKRPRQTRRCRRRKFGNHRETSGNDGSVVRGDGVGESCNEEGATRACCDTGRQTCSGTAEFQQWGPCLGPDGSKSPARSAGPTTASRASSLRSATLDGRRRLRPRAKTTSSHRPAMVGRHRLRPRATTTSFRTAMAMAERRRRRAL